MLIVLALLTLMTTLVAMNAKALHVLKREIQLVEQEQRKKFENARDSEGGDEDGSNPGH